MNINETSLIQTNVSFKKKTTIPLNVTLKEGNANPVVSKKLSLSDTTEVSTDYIIHWKKILNLLIDESFTLTGSISDISASEYNLINNVIFFEADLSTNTTTFDVTLPDWRDYVT
jgi:hypothetical protein